MKQLFVALLTMLTLTASQSASAEGKLGFSFIHDQGFYRTDVVEKDGIRTGQNLIGMGTYYTDSRVEGNHLIMTFAAWVNDMELSYEKNATYYFGRFNHNYLRSSFASYINPKNSNVTIRGDVVEQFEFTVFTNAKKKNMNLTWKDKTMPGYQWDLNLYATPKKGAGTCEGRLVVFNGMNFQELGKLKCKTSGTLEDAFFTSPQDIISWLVQLFLIPDDIRAEKKLSPLL